MPTEGPAHLDILCCDDFASLGVQSGVDIDSEVEFQQAPETFQDASIKVLVVLLLEQLLQAMQASAMLPSCPIIFKDQARQQQLNTCRDSSEQTGLCQRTDIPWGGLHQGQECRRTVERCPHHKAGQAERDDDGLPREGGQVVGDLEVAAVVGQQHRVAHRGEGLDALDEGVLLDAVVARPV